MLAEAWRPCSYRWPVSEETVMEEGRIHLQHVPRAGSHGKDLVEISGRNTTSPQLELRLERGKGDPQLL